MKVIKKILWTIPIIPLLIVFCIGFIVVIPFEYLIKKYKSITPDVWENKPIS